MKLTVELIDKWEMDNGEDFLIDGSTIPYEQAAETESVMIEDMKNSKRGRELIQMVIDDDNYYLEDINELNGIEDIIGLTENEDIRYEIWGLYADAFNKLGFDYNDEN